MRPRSPLVPRLAAAINLDPVTVEATTANWSGEPIPGHHDCWPGPKLFWHDGRPQPTRRVVFEVIRGQPLDKSWVLKPLCMTPNCCQPNHFRMAIRLAKGRFEGEPLPTVTSQPLPPPALGEMTLDEVIDSILEIDARGMDPAALAARFDEPIDKIQAALAQMALEGL